MFTAEVPLPSGSLCALCLVSYCLLPYLIINVHIFLYNFCTIKRGKRRMLDSGHTVVFS